MDAAGFSVPSELAAATARSTDPDRKRWLAELPRRVSDVAARWDLRVGEPFEPGGSAAWVAPAIDADGRDAVLKVAWSHAEARDEAEGLAAWGGDGAVEVYATAHLGQTTAMLLERCRPGAELRSRPEAEQHRVVGALLRRLRGVALPADHHFRSLAQMCDEWGASAVEGHARHPVLLDAGLVREGLALWHHLPTDAPEQVLLCTDLHAGNVLSGERRAWLLVDPKPYVGDPHYDLVQHLLNCQASLQTDPIALVRRTAEAAELDEGRVQRWLFARCVQESWAWPALARVARLLSASPSPG